MGYLNMTVGIGWSIGSLLAGDLYQRGGDKIVLARRYLVEHLAQSEGAIAALERGQVLAHLAQRTGWGDAEVRAQLWSTYGPGNMWFIFAAIGVISLLMVTAYDRVLRAADARPDHPFHARGHRWVQIALGPIVIALGFAAWTTPPGEHAQRAVWLLMATLFGLLLLSSFRAPARAP